MNSPVAIYVHVPFCPSKCGYCDFNSYALAGDIVGRTVEAMLAEIRRSPWRGRPAKTIFFGGGTPTFLDADCLTALLDAVVEAHPPIEGAEITSEANPGTVDQEKFRAMTRAGFNRISLGAQSFVPEDLLRLGRVHGAADVGHAVRAAREAGFANLNLDLMFGLPGQSSRAWRQNLDLALSLKPEHLSLYCLTIEPDTRFARLDRRGMLDLPDEDAQVEFYDLAVACTGNAGYEAYEISNFAKPGYECRHNLCYWRGEEYLAYGPGAVGCFAEPAGLRTRYTNQKHPERYCEAIESAGDLWCASESLDEGVLRTERIMLGLRLREGIDHLPSLDPHALASLRSRGWLEPEGARLRLTPAGRHFCTEVAAALI
ncbi:MAG TPA: radical SAM family heme chaperone HemW [Fimbriimonadaceae bacterium]|nr:radical SAM family heme chaperone HemW [Fimbriimonadaceae bacterium]HRJ96555.1 radical SAM family heme chaperone HemW [Fimbriimonadaceae bacterium]